MIKTDQLPLAAYLICKGARLAAVVAAEAQPDQMAVFCLEGPGDDVYARELTGAFTLGAAAVEPLAYYRALRQLKNAIAHYRHQQEQTGEHKNDHFSGGPETVRD